MISEKFRRLRGQDILVIKVFDPRGRIKKVGLLEVLHNDIGDLVFILLVGRNAARAERAIVVHAVVVRPLDVDILAADVTMDNIVLLKFKQALGQTNH